MSDRSLLHKNKLEEFAVFANRHGYNRQPTKGLYEVLRLKHTDGTILVFYKRNRTDHITSTGDGESLVRRFLDERSWKSAADQASAANEEDYD